MNFTVHRFDEVVNISETQSCTDLLKEYKKKLSLLHIKRDKFSKKIEKIKKLLNSQNVCDNNDDDFDCESIVFNNNIIWKK